MLGNAGHLGEPVSLSPPRTFWNGVTRPIWAGDLASVWDCLESDCSFWGGRRVGETLETNTP